MEIFNFKAFAFGGELDLNRLATKLGITRKYRWEGACIFNCVSGENRYKPTQGGTDYGYDRTTARHFDEGLQKA